MGRGGGRRSYVRDARGRFASTPGGGRKAVKLPAPARRTAGSKPQQRRGLLLQRGAVKRSAAKLRGMDPANQSLSGSLSRRSQKGAVTRAKNRLAAAEQSGRRRLQTGAQQGVIRPGRGSRVMNPEVMPRGRVPAAQRPGSITSTLRGAMRDLAQADARRIREIEAITGQKVRPTASDTKGGRAASAAARAAAAAGGSVTGAMRTALRELAQSDARTIRETERIIRDATPKLPGGGGKDRSRKGVSGSGGQPKLPGGRKTAAKSSAPTPKPAAKPPAPVAKPAAKPTRTVYRTKARAAAAQRERSRQLVEFFRGASRFPRESNQGARIQTTYLDQPNFLTGKTDRVKVRSTLTLTKSLIGQSRASKRTQKRRSRAEARYEQLLQERNAILARGRVKSGVLARNSQRMSAVSRALREYDMGTGRRTPRYKSQKDEWRRSSYGPQG